MPTGDNLRKRGPEHPRWNGGRFTHRTGYVYRYAPDHPHANGRGYVFEHRLVLEEKLGRLLQPEEKVHHRNHIRDDNRPENLELTDDSSHTRLHKTGRRVPAKTRAKIAATKRANLTDAERERLKAMAKKGAQARWGH